MKKKPYTKINTSHYKVQIIIKIIKHLEHLLTLYYIKQKHNIFNFKQYS